MSAKAWFRPLRGSFIAANYKGALAYIPFIAYLAISLIIPLAYAKPKILALFIALPNWIVAAGLMTALARRHLS